MVLIICGFALLTINILLLSYRYMYALYNVQEIILNINILYILFSSTLPFIWWLYSTKEDFWHFYNRKKRTLALCIANAAMCVTQTIWTFIFDVVVVRICQIPTGRNLDANMLFVLCRIALATGTGLVFGAVYAACRRLYENEEIKENIEIVRWQHLFDTRKNKNVAYDLSILRRMDNGSKMTIYENDRFVHTFILGPSGTGKTSSTITPSIVCDFDTKIANREKRVPLILKMVKDGKAQVYSNISNDIDEYSVYALPEYKDELEKIRETFPDCGLTAMAPDNSLLVEILRLAEARDLPCNVIDPSMKYKNKNVRTCGLNPFYVPLGLEPEKRQLEISSRAQNFAEVLLAVSELHGTGDQYFRDINASVTTNVAILCMLHANLNGKQTDITKIQSCISDFGKLRPIVEDIQNKLRIKVVVNEIASAKSLRKDAKDNNRSGIMAPDASEATEDDIIYYEVSSEDEIPEYYRKKGMSVEEYNIALREEAQGYAEHIHFVLQELLGPGGEYMFQQARGLRNILQNLLIDPRIRRILSAPEGAFIDFDKALLNGEIILINTALEFGSTASTALGLFIMLSMNMAVLRRPSANRTNHFIYIDEASQYMHPMFENMFALFRKYRAGVTMAIQSLTQMDKTDVTKYLKGVIMGAGIHIVFGRADPDTMRYYEEIAGIEHKETVQTSVNSNSEFDENYNISSGKRRTQEEKQAVEGSDIRIRDFQEVTVFMVEKGRVRKGIHAKTSFPKDSDFKKKKVTAFDFSKYAVDDPRSANIREKSEANTKAETIIKDKFTTAQRIVNIKDEEDTISTLPPFEGMDTDKITQTVEEKEKIKQRAGRAAILYDSITAKRYEPDKEEDEEVPFTPLDTSLLMPHKEKEKAKRLPNAMRKEKAIKEQQADNIVDDVDFSALLDSESELDDIEEENYEEDSDVSEEEILRAELDRLNNQRKAR